MKKSKVPPGYKLVSSRNHQNMGNSSSPPQDYKKTPQPSGGKASFLYTHSPVQMQTQKKNVK
jgi:hypothetical protein